MKYKIEVSLYPWVMFTFIEIYPDYTSTFAYLYHDIEIDVSTKEYVIKWHAQDAYFDEDSVTKLIDLTVLSEEELFQMQLVWDSIIPFDALLKIQQTAKDGDYKQSTFKRGDFVL